MPVSHLDANHRMSEVVVHGDTIYLAGQVATGATIKAQTCAVLSQVDALLARAGSSKANLLRAEIWLADMADFGGMNGVWDGWIPGVGAPTRATGQVKLAGAEYRVEIIVTAAMP